MNPEERDEMMEKFREGEANVLITTNMMARGIDVSTCDFVINYDVPIIVRSNQIVGDPETYLHRISRTGRFGSKGIALTLLDR